MRVFRSYEELEPAPTCIALGTFDGVHLGHRAVLEQTVAWAQKEGWRSMALTFDPHPLEILAPPPHPYLLTTLEERLWRFRQLGLEAVLVLRFDERLRATEPEAFAEEVLARRVGARGVVCGPGFTFGRDRRGDVALLQDLGARLGFSVRVCPPVEVDGEPVSSSRIRALLREGRVEEAARLLGAPYFARARIGGQRQGESLVRCEVPPRKLLPAPGTYVVRADGQEGLARTASQEVVVKFPEPLPETVTLQFLRPLPGDPPFAPQKGA